MAICICKPNRRRTDCEAHVGFKPRRACAPSFKRIVLSANKAAALDYVESQRDAYFIVEGVPGNPRAILGRVMRTPRLAWKSAAICMGLAIPRKVGA